MILWQVGYLSHLLIFSLASSNADFSAIFVVLLLGRTLPRVVERPDLTALHVSFDQRTPI